MAGRVGGWSHVNSLATLWFNLQVCKISRRAEIPKCGNYADNQLLHLFSYLPPYIQYLSKILQTNCFDLSCPGPLVGSKQGHLRENHRFSRTVPCNFFFLAVSTDNIGSYADTLTWTELHKRKEIFHQILKLSCVAFFGYDRWGSEQIWLRNRWTLIGNQRVAGGSVLDGLPCS